MTPQEKAKDLFEAMYQVADEYNKYPMCFDTAKQCALIAVDEIIKARPTIDGMIIGRTQTRPLTIYYWEQVKQEIEKL